MILTTFFIQYHDTIGFCFDIYRVSHPENYLHVCSFEEKESCKMILEKIGLTGYQVELEFYWI
jgi:hypothetical protein